MKNMSGIEIKEMNNDYLMSSYRVTTIVKVFFLLIDIAALCGGLYLALMVDGALMVGLLMVLFGLIYAIPTIVLCKMTKEMSQEITKRNLKEAFKEGTKETASCLVIIIVIVAIIVGVVLLFKSCDSSSSSTPWEDLGVSKSEYDKVYNHYKYGTPID